jgi:hypothetical protein
MDTEQKFVLRRSIYAYSLYLILCPGISALGLLAWYKTHDSGIFLASLLVWVFTAATLYGDTRYRIFWHNGEIKQISSDKFVTVINTSEITSVGQEKSDLQARLSLRRPLDRIAIYAGHGADKRQIDVSLRHFVNADIRKLMQLIHERRPDLSLPQNWV